MGTGTENGTQRECDLKAAERFTKLLGGSADAEHWFEHGIDDGSPPAATPGTFAEVVAKLKKANRSGRGVFVAVNRIDGDRRKKANVGRIRAVFADFDEGIPNDDELPLVPSIIVHTSPGKAHYYWLLYPDEDMPKDEAERIQRVLVDRYGGDGDCKDITRLLRVPDFFHQKDEPRRITMEVPKWQNEDGKSYVHHYSVEELSEAFPSETKSKLPAKKGAAKIIDLSPNGSGAWAVPTFDAEEVRRALKYIPAHSYSVYMKIMLAIKRGSNLSDEGKEIAREWAMTSKKYDEDEFEKRWALGKEETADGKDEIGLGTLYHIAAEHGYKRSVSTAIAKLPIPAPSELAAKDDKLTPLEFGLKPGEWGDKRKGEMVARMNAVHAVVPIGDKVRYLHRGVDRYGKPGLRFLSKEDMGRLYDAVIVDGNTLTAFDMWRKSPVRTQFTGVGFFPGSPINKAVVPKGYLNLWRDFSIEPAEGDWSLFKKHLRNVVCNRDEEAFNWLMDWMAQMVQCPQVKCGTAVVLKSEQKGSGKSMLIEFFKRIFGPHGHSASQIDHIVGKFNGHLEEAVFFGVEEGFWAGNKQANSVLKTLITQPTLGIERKGLDYYDAPNFTRLLFTSNENWVVPVGTDERRYFVLEFHNKRAKDPDYFDPIFCQMIGENAAKPHNRGLAAMLHELMHREISSDLRRPPTTTGLLNQRAHSLNGPQRWLLAVAKDGEIEDMELKRSIPLHDEGETPIHVRTVKQAAESRCDQYEARNLDMVVGRLLHRTGVKKREKQTGGARRKQYVFPALSTFRAAVERELNVPIDAGEGAE